MTIRVIGGRRAQQFFTVRKVDGLLEELSIDVARKG